MLSNSLNRDQLCRIGCDRQHVQNYRLSPTKLSSAKRFEGRLSVACPLDGANMTQRLLCAKRNDYSNTWKEMLQEWRVAAHEKRLKLNLSAAARHDAHDSDTKRRWRIKSAQSLSQKALYCKAFKDLTHSLKLDPATPGMLDRMKVLHPVLPAYDPVSFIPP